MALMNTSILLAQILLIKITTNFLYNVSFSVWCYVAFLDIVKIFATFLEPMFFLIFRPWRTKLGLVPFFLISGMAAILNFKMAADYGQFWPLFCFFNTQNYIEVIIIPINTLTQYKHVIQIT